MKTKVIFRKWKHGISRGTVIALFPEEPADMLGTLCLSYEHVGQHGGASMGIIRRLCAKATPEEYADLKAELEGIGYDLQVCQRVPPKSSVVRWERIQAMRKDTF